MDGRNGKDAEKWKVPTWRGSHRRMPVHEYKLRALELDRNYSVVEWGPQSVLLRLDFPGTGLADMPELLRAMHFDSLWRDATGLPTLFP
jgi:hypothetical protein